ncbi:MAG: hypothetical protein KDA41_01695 [Planctomycetales bacterium]|nr:hypothetical protein [Planctomycetales bacterium]
MVEGFAARSSTSAASHLPLTQLARAAILSCAGVLLLVASLLACGRWLAPAADPIGWPTLVALAVGCALLASGLRAAHARLGLVDAVIDRWILHAALPAALVLAGLSLTQPGSSLVGQIAWWLIVAAEELYWLARRKSSSSQRIAPGAATVVEQALPEAPDAELRPSLPANATQSLLRVAQADGSEVVQGVLRAVAAAQERTVYVHVAFCPPLVDAPQVTCRQLDGPPAEIKTAQSQCYGVRFDVRFKRASSEPAEVMLQFTAVGGPPAERR